MSDCISIHAPPRGATWKPCKSRSNHLFQFTPLREGRRKAQSATAWHPYFNSRPSARGDVCGKYSDNSITISIHAPPRGATARDNALPKTWSISIHAPPRGATTGMMSVSAACVFQFTPLREGRQAENGHEKGGKKFQFTPLREGRRLLLADSFDVRLHFNSRPSARGDLETVQKSLESFISIHAPPRGATSNPRIAPNPAYFNSRPSARGDPLQPSSLLSSTNFNSRPSARGDKRRQEQRRKQEFQFTPLREGRPDEQPPRAATTTISIHAPPRGAT